MKGRYVITTVVERFVDPDNNVPRERLACGHVRTDPVLWREGEVAFKLSRLAKAVTGEPARARCYKCAKGGAA